MILWQGHTRWGAVPVKRGPYFLGVPGLSTWAGLSRGEILMISPLPAPKKSVFEKQIFYPRSQSRGAKKMRGLFNALLLHRACPSPTGHLHLGAPRSGPDLKRRRSSAYQRCLVRPLPVITSLEYTGKRHLSAYQFTTCYQLVHSLNKAAMYSTLQQRNTKGYVTGTQP